MTPESAPRCYDTYSCTLIISHTHTQSPSCAITSLLFTSLCTLAIFELAGKQNRRVSSRSLCVSVKGHVTCQTELKLCLTRPRRRPPALAHFLSGASPRSADNRRLHLITAGETWKQRSLNASLPVMAVGSYNSRCVKLLPPLPPLRMNGTSLQRLSGVRELISGFRHDRKDHHSRMKNDSLRIDWSSRQPDTETWGCADIKIGWPGRRDAALLAITCRSPPEAAPGKIKSLI